MKLRGLFAALCLLGHLLAGPGALAFLCSMDGGLHAAPCCPGPAHGTAENDQGGHPAPVAGTRSCCELTAPTSAPAPATADRPQRLDVQEALALLPRLDPVPPPVARAYPPRAPAEPDPGGPPVFLRHCALLI